MKFAEKLRQLRNQKGMSQEAVAKAIGVTRRTYISYELDGRYPKDRERYTKLAEVFGVDVNYLYTENEDFVSRAGRKYGDRGIKQATALVSELSGLFAGGELTEEDRDAVMQSLQEAYWLAKKENRKYGSRNSKG
ncbi:MULTISPECIES: helix-turn-helix transcriptional regulator [Selenomonas]|jgi:transcriptional regulator with XRE-family HTH domain|uniref:DNA-binding transcriptional regulator, XRE-family HTH domain n=1 Tax=Selenomonas ruminantium TaxID=971 RepID=A0A1K1QUT1_SELRU|nr:MULTISPECIES: helix-turn-helix transcriptional regulator [Selenomonas]MBE6086269.1 XRE family transcriptional regulator [Selenomonas ruminantium]SFB14764.1 DNA-binding transcriptional regulator, XRE-family HTH domain [Selenomonas ruminantium]SFW63387.1 DNA-binding transcriptional regulator, XRE-family HTH domain [Selenomonas ruminantium]